MPERIRACVKTGIGIGAVVSAWVGALATLQMSTTIVVRSGSPEVNVFHVIALYLVGGAAAGAIVGVLQPLAKWKLGAAFVGVAAAIPVAVGVVAVVTGFSAWNRDHVLLLATLCLVLGSTLGIGYREIFYEG